MKNKLKELELERTEGDAIENGAANKAFKPLSTAQFLAN
jgi:hypothetical protein